MNIAVAGGTGFIGKVILRKLVADGHHVVALIRPGSLLKINKFSGTESRYTYYDSPTQLLKNIEDCQAVINLIGIIKETKETSYDFAHHIVPLSLVTAAKNAGIKRFLQMSALGVDSDSDSEYFVSKRLGENVVKASVLDWTIFRPSLVYGQGDNMTALLAKIIKHAPFFPVIGDGQYQFQPVHVENVADGFVQALNKPETIGKVYDIAGADKYTFDQILDMIAQAIGKKGIAKLHQPLGLIMFKAKLWGRFMPGPLTPDAVKMLIANCVSDDDSFQRTFDTKFIPFAEGIRGYLK